MRRLVVCCDGTWNTADENQQGIPTPTNVRLFHNALADVDAEGIPQLRHYVAGVGTEGSKLTRTIEGDLGIGLSREIENAYLWLASTYRPGDRISLIGFSRGAFTARSLVGLLARCGLLRFDDSAPSGSRAAAVRTVYDRGYVAREDPSAWGAGLAFHPGCEPGARPARGSRIEFVGVWDTVGALGVPHSLALLDLLDDPARYRFHDTHLTDEVGVARHALALDEFRGMFTPTLWTDPATGAVLPNDDRVQQRWFPGAHVDVGGGAVGTGLSDGGLRWMVDEAAAAVGLAFRPTLLDQIRPDPLGVLHESVTGLFEHLSSAPRTVPHVGTDPAVHPSAVERSETGPLRQDAYRQGRRLAVGESHETDVLAPVPWCPAGLWLEPGTYTFAAAGEWFDGDVPAGPGGVTHPSWRANVVYSAADLWGRVETLWRRRNPAAEFAGTKRWEPAAWMELVAVVANGAGVGADRGTDGHQYVVVGTAVAGVRVEHPGYLYAFANDAWGLYGSNRGSVVLTATRTA